uniref:Putative microsomal triglyceride transfer protein n=1 Tax=Panstrongylus lignarius TaxID=156445 RepID=A0A224XJE2_9HEMI
MNIQLIDFSIIIFFASASIVETETYKFGNEYQFEQTILFYDGSKSHIGYQIKGELKLELLNKDLYLIQLENPKLLFYSKKCPKNYGFVPHKSNIDSYNNDPFIVELSEGKVTKIFIVEEDDKGIINLKKAISNLFQFQTSNYHGVESDLSGTCTVSYKVTNSDHIVKIKDNCILSNSTAFKTSIWGGKLISKRKGDIFLENGKIISIISWEEHVLTPHLSELIISNISSKVEMKLSGSEILKEKYPSEDMKSIVAKVEANKGKVFEIYDLGPQRIEDSCLNCPRFAKVISENAEYLEDKYLGSSKSASVYIEAVKAARRSSLHDIYNVINAKRNKKILPQLMDILGAAQTINTHQAAFKVLKINTEKYDLNLCERYFWALSMAPTIQPYILAELQELVKTKHQNNKLWQTIILTMATAVNKYATHQEHSDEVVTQMVDLLKNKVKKCKGNEQCQELYIKALSSIHNEKSISVLLEIIDTAPKKSIARAMKGISKINPQLWNKDIVSVAEEVLQSSQTYDSSARIFAMDILLRSRPSLGLLSRIVSVLKQEDKSRELKEYLLQRLVELSESNNTFKKLWKQIYIENGYNNYDALGQGGLSTAFARPFMPNGTLSTSQEIVGGILKQGTVNINLLHNEKIVNPFTLGIFAAGLASFVSTDEESSEDEEISTAGLELTVLGVDLRPFIFFNGTGELMGHVWSGTASSLTPVYQALLFLEDDTFSIFLGIGEELVVRLESAASVDLSGEIEISLWNRNAHSLVKNRAGIFLRNSISINAPYIEANMNADLSVEPELNLSADLDFSNGATLCLQLHQPKTSINGRSEKWESIIGTNKMARRTRNMLLPVYGKTYALNFKNNYMCNKIFSS